MVHRFSGDRLGFDSSLNCARQGGSSLIPPLATPLPALARNASGGERWGQGHPRQTADARAPLGRSAVLSPSWRLAGRTDGVAEEAKMLALYLMDADLSRDLLEIFCVAPCGVKVSVVLDLSPLRCNQLALRAKPVGVRVRVGGSEKIVVSVMPVPPPLGDQLVVEAGSRLGHVTDSDPDSALLLSVNPAGEVLGVGRPDIRPACPGCRGLEGPLG